MASQNVDFKNTSDTGENSPASVKPVLDGERATAQTFNRPTENLRVRTEVLKAKAEDLLYLGDADRAMIITGGGSLSWDGAVLSISEPLVIRPHLAPPLCTPARLSIGEGATEVVIETKPYGAAETPTATPTPLRAYSGANKVRVKLTGSEGTALSVSVVDTNRIEITYDTSSVNGTTLQALVTAINDSAANTDYPHVYAYMGSSVDPLTVSAVKLGAAALVPFSAVTDNTLYLSGAVDAEKHVITPGALSQFFSAGSGTTLAVGDTLAIRYDDLVLPSGGGRRQSIEQPPENKATIPTGSLFKVTAYPQYAGGSIPICTVTADGLVFLTGERLEAGASNVLGGTTAANITYGTSPTTWADQTSLVGPSVKHALDHIVEALGVEGDGSKLGYVADPAGHLTTGSVKSALDELDIEKAGLELPNEFRQTNYFKSVNGTGVRIQPGAGIGLIIDVAGGQKAAIITGGASAATAVEISFPSVNVGGVGIEARGGAANGTVSSNANTGVGVAGYGGEGVAGTNGPGYDKCGGSGVEGYGGLYGGVGLKGTGGNVSGPGVHGIGGTPAGTGVVGEGSAQGGVGVWGVGIGTYAGVVAKNSAATALDADGNVAASFKGTVKGIDVTTGSGIAITAKSNGGGVATIYADGKVSGYGLKAEGFAGGVSGYGTGAGAYGVLADGADSSTGIGGAGLIATGGSSVDEYATSGTLPQVAAAGAGVVATGGEGNPAGVGVLASGGIGATTPLSTGGFGVSAFGNGMAPGIRAQGGDGLNPAESSAAGPLAQADYARGAGIYTVGGWAAGAGIVAQGGATGTEIPVVNNTLSGVGVVGIGTAQGEGVVGFGGPSSAQGVYGWSPTYGVTGVGGDAGIHGKGPQCGVWAEPSIAYPSAGWKTSYALKAGGRIQQDTDDIADPVHFQDTFNNEIDNSNTINNYAVFDIPKRAADAAPFFYVYADGVTGDYSGTPVVNTLHSARNVYAVSVQVRDNNFIIIKVQWRNRHVGKACPVFASAWLSKTDASAVSTEKNTDVVLNPRVFQHGLEYSTTSPGQTVMFTYLTVDTTHVVSPSLAAVTTTSSLAPSALPDGWAIRVSVSVVGKVT